MRLATGSVAAALLLAGCEREHRVRVLLGPTPDTITMGFRCVEDANPNRPLLARAIAGDEIQFNLVIDVISFGGRFPGCRGEEILRTCGSGSCSIPGADASRYCVAVRFPVSVAASDRQIIELVRPQLASTVVSEDAPDGPVTLRAVATTQPCDAIDDASDGLFPSLDPDLAIGCAYSCPLVLDDADGPISMSFDTLTNRCEQAVRVCAAFPGR